MSELLRKFMHWTGHVVGLDMGGVARRGGWWVCKKCGRKITS